MSGTLELLCQQSNLLRNIPSQNLIQNLTSISDFGIEKSLFLVRTLEGISGTPSVANIAQSITLNPSVLETLTSLPDNSSITHAVYQALNLTKQREEAKVCLTDLREAKKENWSAWTPSDEVTDRIHHTTQSITEALPKTKEAAEKVLPAKDRELLSRISNESKSSKLLTPSNIITLIGIAFNLADFISSNYNAAVATKYQQQIIANQEQHLENEKQIIENQNEIIENQEELLQLAEDYYATIRIIWNDVLGHEN